VADQRPSGALDPNSDGGMPLPWIGRGYRRGGLVTLGISLREASGKMMEYVITEDAEGQIDILSRDGHKPHGSWFAYGSACSAAAVLRSQSGEAELLVEDSQSLAPVLDQIARLQGVKSSPEDHDRSARNKEMKKLYPVTYLPEEFTIVQPGTTRRLRAREPRSSHVGVARARRPGPAHDRNDLLNLGRIRGIAEALVSRRAAGVEARHRRRRSASTSAIKQQFGHGPSGSKTETDHPPPAAAPRAKQQRNRTGATERRLPPLV